MRAWMGAVVWFAVPVASLAGPNQGASARNDYCDRVALAARAVMTARQFGLSYESARLRLSKDELKANLIDAAYLIPREAGDRKPFEVIDAFAAERQSRCLSEAGDR